MEGKAFVYPSNAHHFDGGDLFPKVWVEKGRILFIDFEDPRIYVSYFYHFGEGYSFDEAFPKVEYIEDKVRRFLAIPTDIRSFKLESPSLQEGSFTTASIATGKDPSRCFYLFYHLDTMLMGILPNL